MRTGYLKQLKTLHTDLIRLAALCEDAIASAVKGLLDDDESLREKARNLEREIGHLARDVDDFCVKLLIREQPVASDLRRITAAQRMIIDMERIGDQSSDISEIAEYLQNTSVKSDVHLSDMARAALSMLNDAIDSFVMDDVQLAKKAISLDDSVDDLFSTIRSELIDIIQNDSSVAQDCLDLLMIAKYLERIGDHAENIAWWVVYSVSGIREGSD